MKSKTETHKKGRSQTATDRTGLIIRVVEAGEIKRYDQLMEANHYLGRAHRVGDFLRQVVERDGEWIALLAWGPAGLHMKDRDKWIGWNPLQRAERLKLVAQNRRFLLLTERGKEPNLASKWWPPLVLMGFHDHLPVDREVGLHLGIRTSGDKDKGLDADHFADWGKFRFTAYKLSRVAKRLNWIGD